MSLSVAATRTRRRGLPIRHQNDTENRTLTRSPQNMMQAPPHPPTPTHPPPPEVQKCTSQKTFKNLRKYNDFQTRVGKMHKKSSKAARKSSIKCTKWSTKCTNPPPPRSRVRKPLYSLRFLKVFWSLGLHGGTRIVRRRDCKGIIHHPFKIKGLTNLHHCCDGVNQASPRQSDEIVKKKTREV